MTRRSIRSTWWKCGKVTEARGLRIRGRAISVDVYRKWSMTTEQPAENSSELVAVPSDDAELSVIHNFALSFDGYSNNGDEVTGFDKCAVIANRAQQMWLEKKVLPESLHDLRTCLFFEQRRHHWDAPTGIDFERAMVRRIREISGDSVPLDPNSPLAARRRQQK